MVMYIIVWSWEAKLLPIFLVKTDKEPGSVVVHDTDGDVDVCLVAVVDSPQHYIPIINKIANQPRDFISVILEL